MTHRIPLRTALAVIAGLAVAPALADDPGPGGSRPVVSRTGEEVYRNVCQACHMAGGKGGVGAGRSRRWRTIRASRPPPIRSSWC